MNNPLRLIRNLDDWVGRNGIKMVRRWRLNDKAHYRHQENVERPYVAYLYNAMVAYLNREAMDQIRNREAREAEEDIVYQWNLLRKSDPDFKRFMRKEFMVDYIDPELLTEAKAFYRSVIR